MAAFLDRNELLDPSRQHIERADPGRAAHREDHVARADAHPQRGADR